MSLNKFTDDVLKSWMSIGCNSIKSNTLEVAGSVVKGSISGIYTPNITFFDGSTTSNVKAVYSIVGNNDDAVFDCNIMCEVTVQTSTTVYIMVLPLPPGYKLLNLTNQSVVIGNLHTRGHNNHYTAYRVDQPALGGSDVYIFFETDTFPNSIPIGIGTNYISLNIKSSVAKI